MDLKTRSTDFPGASAAVLTLRAELAAGMRELGSIALEGRDVRVLEGRDAVWVIVRRTGRGGVAIRAAHTPGGAHAIKRRGRPSKTELVLDLTTAQGAQSLTICSSAADLPTLRVTATLTPAANC